MFCHRRFFWMSKSNLLVFFYSCLYRSTSLSDVDLTTVAVYNVHSQSLQCQVFLNRTKKTGTSELWLDFAVILMIQQQFISSWILLGLGSRTYLLQFRMIFSLYFCVHLSPYPIQHNVNPVNDRACLKSVWISSFHESEYWDTACYVISFSLGVTFMAVVNTATNTRVKSPVPGVVQL